MNRSPAANPARLSVLALAILLGGCSSLSNPFASDKVDYRSSANAGGNKPLEVPPDLSQLARDTRYQSQGGVISAAATAAPAAAAAAAAASAAPGEATVAIQARGDVRVERDGDTRWLVTSLTPDQLWPQLKAFWQERGLPIVHEDKTAGVMETGWVENRIKLPQGIIRNTIGGVVDQLFDTGERDKYVLRIERSSAGSEIYISHRGMKEVYTDAQKESTAWELREREPALEVEMLSQLMVKLGTKEAAARPAVANAPEAAPRARALGNPALALEVDEGFDRAWRRVGLALDRGGFTVEDRDRARGLYFVRYIDPKYAGKDAPGWWARLFNGGKDPGAPQHYRIVVKASAGNSGQSTVSVLNGDGSAGAGENGQRIISQLVQDLR